MNIYFLTCFFFPNIILNYFFPLKFLYLFTLQSFSRFSNLLAELSFDSIVPAVGKKQKKANFEEVIRLQTASVQQVCDLFFSQAVIGAMWVVIFS